MTAERSDTWTSGSVFQPFSMEEPLK